MATLNIAGAGHPGDPFQVQIVLKEADLEDARSARGLILEPADLGYDADPQIRTVVVQVAESPTG